MLRESNNIQQLDFANVELVGREFEIQKLHRIYDECTVESKVLLLHGNAGSGKSFLMHSQNDLWTKNNGFFVCGNFDVHKASTPFSAITDAITELCTLWCSSSDDGINGLKSFLKEISVDDIILRRFLPHIYDLAGIEQTHENIPSNLSSKTWDFKRLLHVLKILFRRICSSSQRVVVFFDNFHNADQASVDLLGVFSDHDRQSGQVKGLLVVVSYRDEEVTDMHIIETLKRQEKTENIQVRNLEIPFVAKILSSLTNRECSDVYPLAEVLHRKTGGNPFYIRQLLQWMQNDGLLYYSMQSYSWEWANVEQIQSEMNLSENVADVVELSMKKLQKETQEALMIGSCLGSRFSLNNIVAFFNHDLKKEFRYEEGTKMHFKLSGKDSSYISQILEVTIDHNILTLRGKSSIYAWSHDKLREAMYSLIEEEEGITPSQIHLHLGILLSQMSCRNIEGQATAFLAAEQMNLGSSLLSDSADLVKLAEMNLRAAEMSVSRSAFYHAANLLRRGVSLLNPTTKWEKQYHLSLQLFSLLAEMEYLLGHDNEATLYVNEILTNAHSLKDKYRAQLVLIETIGGRHREYNSAVKACLELLDLHGIRLPAIPLKVQVLGEKLKLKAMLQSKRIEEMLNFPPMIDSRAMMISKLLGNLMVFAVASDQKALAVIVAIRSIRLSWTYGIGSHSPIALAVFGIAKLFDGSIEGAYEYALFALKLLRKVPTSEWYSRTALLVYGGLLYLKRPFHEDLEPSLKLYHRGLENGDLEVAYEHALRYGLCYFTIGLPLGPLVSDLLSFRDQARRYGMSRSVEVKFSIYLETIYDLQSNSTKDAVLLEKSSRLLMDQNKFLNIGDEAHHLESKVATLLHSFRLQLAYIFEDLIEAEKLLETIPMQTTTGGLLMLFNHDTYVGLASFAISKKTGKKRYRRMGQKIIQNVEKAVRNGSVNYYHILLMLRVADLTIDETNQSIIKKRYDAAIKVCTRSGFIHHAAIMNEHAGLFFLDIGEEDWAKFYLTRSINKYWEWGATAKVDHMLRQHLFLKIDDDEATPVVGSRLKARSRFDPTASKYLKEFDFSSVIESSTLDDTSIHSF